VKLLNCQARGLLLVQVGPLLRLVEQPLQEVAAEGILDDLVIGPGGVARFCARATSLSSSSTWTVRRAVAMTTAYLRSASSTVAAGGLGGRAD
jgi:hypothetical protein